MPEPSVIHQTPQPGTRLKRYCGDTLVITLQVDPPCPGKAFIRTTIGQAGVSRREIIDQVLRQTPILGHDWYDHPMGALDKGRWQIRLPLNQVGSFEAKAYFLKNDGSEPVWPPGPNLKIKVEPADTVCANIIYNAFVRQFGPSKKEPQVLPRTDERILSLDRENYTVIPPSGTFRDLTANLDFIIETLGCRIIQLLPVHPTPTTYARMGRFGSPYAALNFKAVNPALAQFDPKTTPLEQFMELVEAVQARGAKLFLDIAINHTGWAASLHETHPHWLARQPDGQIECPGAWGVTWEDLTKLDYAHTDLWQYMADIFLTWCRRGVDGFRCDAGYMIPEAAWQFMIARVRETYPDTIFFLEGLGGKISVTENLLTKAGFNWAYSELFQNYSRQEIEHYLPQALDLDDRAGTLAHYAETHDNNRLAARNPTWAALRTALCALFNQNGAFGFANGVEWLATEKINVHEVTGLNWGASDNLVAHLQRLHALLHFHPAFFDQCRLSLVTKGEGTRVVLKRTYAGSGGQSETLWVVANLDDQQPTRATWPKPEEWSQIKVYDLVTNQAMTVEFSPPWCRLHLEPGQVVALTHKPPLRASDPPLTFGPSKRVQQQQAKALILDLWVHFRGLGDLGDLDLNSAVKALCNSPVAFTTQLNPDSAEPRAVVWQWPQDTRREVMIPDGQVLLIKAPHPFSAHLIQKDRCRSQTRALPLTAGGWFAILFPGRAAKTHQSATLNLSVFENKACRRARAPLLVLAASFPKPLRTRWKPKQLAPGHIMVLDTNGHGSVMRTNACWGHLNSRYDALLSVSVAGDYPDDRLTALTRSRVWVEYQGFSHALDNDCLTTFSAPSGTAGRWRFKVPMGQGRWIEVTLKAALSPGTAPQLNMVIQRHPAQGRQGCLADTHQVRFVVRPDLEDRSFHHITKAFTGPEHQFPEAIHPFKNGFRFAPRAGHTLEMTAEAGTFVVEPEWQYMVELAVDAQRGLEGHTDLFSPGYFEFRLAGRGQETLSARMKIFDSQSTPPPKDRRKTPTTEPGPSTPQKPWLALLRSNMVHYLTRRNGLSTVMAGFPWFLDWGRDALIFARGLMAAGQTQTVEEILTLFGQFEDRGRLPNMIQGQTPANWDTSDAPLWFIVVCGDLYRATDQKKKQLLERPCGKRTLRQVLISIGRHYSRGTPNGIYMDQDSGLIFSPGHFTWMDTNHPAGTPRQGYPIEIQALWFAALDFLAEIDTPPEFDWKALANQVAKAISGLFFQAQWGSLSDCLHAQPGQSAAEAQPDDALRPNQLLALTLGAIKSKEMGRSILAACQTLLVPGGIRSLADRPLEIPLAIHHHQTLLNDPDHPYQGRYQGDEDTRRKPAYHNGSAWTWPFPAFAEAWVQVYGPRARKTALAWLSSSAGLLDRGCLGHLPEILDGDAPHAQRGCDAQAWGMSELLRVLTLLSHTSNLKSRTLDK